MSPGPWIPGCRLAACEGGQEDGGHLQHHHEAEGVGEGCGGGASFEEQARSLTEVKSQPGNIHFQDDQVILFSSKNKKSRIKPSIKENVMKYHICTDLVVFFSEFAFKSAVTVC